MFCSIETKLIHSFITKTSDVPLSRGPLYSFRLDISTFLTKNLLNCRRKKKSCRDQSCRQNNEGHCTTGDEDCRPALLLPFSPKGNKRKENRNSFQFLLLSGLTSYGWCWKHSHWPLSDGDHSQLPL